MSRQLGGPSGPLGAVVARMLNKGNAATITAAVEALELDGGETVTDIGFGGGLGLDLLLAAVGASGQVHGVEPSSDMLARARRTHATAVADGRLELHEAPMEALPFADGAIDGWISINTIYFVADPTPAARELARVLSPSGRGVLGMADPQWMARQAFTQYTFTIRPVADVIGALEDGGVTVEHRTLGEMPFHLLVCRPSA